MSRELSSESKVSKPGNALEVDLPLKEDAWWRRNRTVLAWIAVGMLPVSAAIAFALLHAMASAAAAVTGGCGGG